MPIARADQSVLGRWWWTVDRWTLGAFALLIIIGFLLVQAASPAVAAKLGQESFSFVTRHFLLLTLSVIIIFGLSLFAPPQIRVIALLTFAVSLILLLLLPFIGVEVKGAKRWIHLAGQSIQPSEFLKPCFIIISARLFARGVEVPKFPGRWLAIGLYFFVIFLLLRQPDVGMSVLITAVFACQLFLSGIPLVTVPILAGVGIGGIVGAYYLFPHFTDRMNRFLDPEGHDNYQVLRSLEAFRNGGWLGTGPGEGQVKASIPDAHTDFIFAVAGEEYGIIACCFIVALFAFIVLRGFWRLRGEQSLFIFLAVTGLLVEFGLQAIINMGSTLHLLPTKGMTLPFISYGGTSLLTLSISAGFLLALTRKRYGQE